MSIVLVFIQGRGKITKCIENCGENSNDEEDAIQSGCTTGDGDEEMAKNKGGIDYCKDRRCPVIAESLAGIDNKGDTSG